MPRQVKPTGRRLRKTVPIGWPDPIFSAMRWRPTGVLFEPIFCPDPNREVDAAHRRRHLYRTKILVADRLAMRSNTSRIWVRIFTTTKYRVSETPCFRQTHLKPSGNFTIGRDVVMAFFRERSTSRRKEFVGFGFKNTP